MNFIFSTPRRHRVWAGLFMAANIGNIIAFPVMKHGVVINSTAQGIFATVFHLLTILLLAMGSGHLASQGDKMKQFIRMMEDTGFTYYPATREFKPNGTKPEE